jgi:hypothetical protein
MIQLLIRGKAVATVRDYAGPSADTHGGSCSFTIAYSPQLPILGVHMAQLELDDGTTRRITVTGMTIDEEMHTVHFTGTILVSP